MKLEVKLPTLGPKEWKMESLIVVGHELESPCKLRSSVAVVPSESQRTDAHLEKPREIGTPLTTSIPLRQAVQPRTFFIAVAI
jgi:hypothetical protein